MRALNSTAFNLQHRRRYQALTRVALRGRQAKKTTGKNKPRDQEMKVALLVMTALFGGHRSQPPTSTIELFGREPGDPRENRRDQGNRSSMARWIISVSHRG